MNKSPIVAAIIYTLIGFLFVILAVATQENLNALKVVNYGIRYLSSGSLITVIIIAIHTVMKKKMSLLRAYTLQAQAFAVIGLIALLSAILY